MRPVGQSAFRSVLQLLWLAWFSFLGLFACFGLAAGQVGKEFGMRKRFGDAWRTEFENAYGSVAANRFWGAMAALAGVGIVFLVWWLARELRSNGQYSKRKPKRRTHESRLERYVRYRRNALLAVYFGVPGLLGAVALAVFRWGLFSDHSNEVALAIFVFIAAYAVVIAGCGWWLKAKEWPDAVLSIGLMPVLIFAVPYVRNVFVLVPMLLPLAMVMMPLVLVVVVLVLPDRSGYAGRTLSSKAQD